MSGLSRELAQDDAIRRAYEAGRKAAATPLDEEALQAELDR
jgi:hypothetical protein